MTDWLSRASQHARGATKMSFFNKTNNIVIVDTAKELLNRAQREVLFTDISKAGTFH